MEQEFTSLTNFRREGDKAFPQETETDNSADSSSEQTATTTPSQTENQKPAESNESGEGFHTHPRWKQREQDWERRLQDTERRWEQKLNEVKTQSASARSANENSDIPEWFGGDQKQWEQYKQHEDTRIAQAEERAIARIKAAEEAEKTKVADATKFFQDEITALETTAGTRIDQNKLLKIVLDNELIDAQGRWNYKAGYQIYKAQEVASKPQSNTGARKQIASATTDDRTGEETKRNFMTSDDFKGQNRPW